MRVTVDGVELFFDVDGAELVVDGRELRRRPSVVLLHGGPGGDHSQFKPFLEPLREVAQLIYLDLRGQGRSGGDDPADWNLPTWSADVRRLCDLLAIERPIVLGCSFGSFVALQYATDHPAACGGLVLLASAARFLPERTAEAFGRLHGAAERAAAQRFFSTSDPAAHAAYRALCHPCYAIGTDDGAAADRIRARPDVSRHFFGDEARRFDLREAAGRIACPVLVVNGLLDPVTTAEGARELAAALPPKLVELRLLPDVAHDLAVDAPETVLALVRAFVSRLGAAPPALSAAAGRAPQRRGGGPSPRSPARRRARRSSR